MGCSGSTSTDTKSSLSPEQREALRAVNKYVVPKIGQGATPYTGELVAGMGEAAKTGLEDFYASIGQNFETTRPYLEDLASGRNFYEYDPEGITSDWEKNFAKPMMRVWNDTLKPQIEESYNLPGSFSSSRKSQGVARAGNEFYDKSVAPTLFNAQQAERQRSFNALSQAKGMQLPSIQALQGQSANQLGQILSADSYERDILNQGYTADYREFLRTSPEQDPWTQLAMGYMTNPTEQLYQSTDPDRIGQLISAGGTAAGLAIGLS